MFYRVIFATFVENYNGDLVMITTADCGLTGIFEEQNEKYICSAYAVKIALNKSLAYPYYFKYYFQTALAKNEVNKYIRKATVANLPASDILKFSHRLPIKQEQEKIASFLSSVDYKIEQLTKKEELLKQYKKGVMQKIFNQEIRFKADDGSNFCDWEEKKLGEIANITIGEFVIKTKQNPDALYPVYNGGKTNTGFYNEYNNEGNQIIISARGANAGFVNFEVRRYWAGNSCYSISMIDNSFYNINFYYYYIKHFENKFTDFQQAANIPSVSKKEVNDFKVITLKIEEQNKIANFLSSIDTKIQQTQKQLESSKEFKKALLQQMFV